MGQREFIPRLESLRGVAAVLVGVYHCACMFLPFPNSGAYRPIFGFANGLGCVVVFFVISGYVLTRSLDNSAGPHWWKFMRNRAFRLLPAAIVVVGLLTFLHERYGFYVGFEASFTPLNVLLNMLLLKSDINGVMWSLTVELAATPLIFVSVLAYRRWGRRPLLLAVLILFAMSFVGQYRDMIGANLAPLYAFLVGVLVHFEGPRLVRGMSSKFGTGIAIAGTVLFLVAGMLKQDSGFMVLLDCLGGGMLVVAISQFQNLAILRPLDWPVARLYGRISYSYYLLHMIFISLVLMIGGTLLKDLSPLGTAAALSLVTMLATALPAFVLYLAVEIPGIAIGRWFFNGTRANAISQQPANDAAVEGRARVGAGEWRAPLASEVHGISGQQAIALQKELR